EKLLASLNRREADIAVRMSRPEDGDYAIVKLGETSFHLYASKTYLETVSPSDWTFIVYDETMNASPQQLRPETPERMISRRSAGQRRVRLA
ncbi:hypothetical protein AB9E26_35660, partial [Rhizobium leguminosarum]